MPSCMKYITIFDIISTLHVNLYRILYPGPLYNQAHEVTDASRYLGVNVPDDLTCLVLHHTSEVAGKANHTLGFLCHI